MQTVLTNSLFAIGILVILAWAFTEYQLRRQRPLAEFSSASIARAFRVSPEDHAHVSRRGTLSRLEMVQQQKLAIGSIDAELQRRTVAG